MSFVALLRQPHALSVVADHVAPRRRPGGLRVGDGGGDLAQRVVVLLGEARIGGEDHVRVGVGHGLEIDAVGLVEQDGGLGAQFGELLGDPRQQAVTVVVAEVGGGHTDGHHAQREGNLVVGPVDGGDPLRLGRDGRGAEGVLDDEGVALAGVRCARRGRLRRGRSGLGGRGRVRGAGGEDEGGGADGGGEHSAETHERILTFDGVNVPSNRLTVRF